MLRRQLLENSEKFGGANDFTRRFGQRIFIDFRTQNKRVTRLLWFMRIQLIKRLLFGIQTLKSAVRLQKKNPLDTFGESVKPFEVLVKVLKLEGEPIWRMLFDEQNKTNFLMKQNRAKSKSELS